MQLFPHGVKRFSFVVMDHLAIHAAPTTFTTRLMSTCRYLSSKPLVYCYVIQNNFLDNSDWLLPEEQVAVPLGGE